MNSPKIVIRFSEIAVQPARIDSERDGSIQRIIGFVEARNLLPLFDEASLDANPRSAKVGNVTNEILDTLVRTPELFRFKSKGILLGTSSFEALQRNRYLLRFEDTSIEGVLDGGHNMLAIGLHILRDLVDEKEWKSIKFWDDMKILWNEHRSSIEEIKDELTFYVPVELLVPASTDADDVDAFTMSLLEICAARNNNAQLTQEAKSNKRGFYDAIRDRVPEEFAKRVEWRPNSWEDEEEKHPIKIRDLVALAWIPLNHLNDDGQLPLDISVSPQNIYRNKGECSQRFDELMKNVGVTTLDNGPRHTLHHSGVESAFAMLADLPDLYDQIYADFPEAYNGHNLRFGANPIVKVYAPAQRAAAKDAGKDVKGYTSTQPYTPFMKYPVKHSYPEGLIVPLVYGLKGLMEVKNGRLVWGVEDPKAFIGRNLAAIAGSYKLVIHMAKWDPQKVAKDPASHEFAENLFRSALTQERAEATLVA
jgi:hypothetical protein